MLLVGFTNNLIRIIWRAVKNLSLSWSMHKICIHTCIWNIYFSSWPVPTRNMQIPLNVSILNLQISRYFIQDNIFSECQTITTTINNIMLDVVSWYNSTFTCVVLDCIKVVIHSNYLALFCSHTSTTCIVAIPLQSLKILQIHFFFILWWIISL